jgi:hypothetical protein
MRGVRVVFRAAKTGPLKRGHFKVSIELKLFSHRGRVTFVASGHASGFPSSPINRPSTKRALILGCVDWPEFFWPKIL